MRSVLFNFKFRRKKALSAHLALLAGRRLMEWAPSVQVITSVPMNGKKERARGYNQSEVIAKGLSRMFGIPYAVLLKERKTGINQKSLGYRERFFNAIGRYQTADSERTLNRNVLIVDDVFTTGSTVNECARVLLEAGAAGVFSVALARTPAGVSPWS